MGLLTETRHAGVLGRPIVHSLSPVLHRAAYAALGLNWTYQAIDCGVADLAGVLAARTGWAGFSATMPLKRAVLEVAAQVSPLAAAVGAANTLLPRPGGGWIAENTDVAGVVQAVRAGGVQPESVTVLGAGGTAQATVAALPELGIRACSVLVRELSRADALRQSAEAVGVSVTFGSLAADARALSAGLVVSTLPRGVADALAGYAWQRGQTVLDVVYDPWPTRLAESVAAAGGQVLSGALMLLHQAAEQVRLMTDRPAPTDAMRVALAAATGLSL